MNCGLPVLKTQVICNLSRAHTLKSDLLINMMAQPCPGLALTPLAPPGLESVGTPRLLPQLSLDSALLGLETIPDL